MNTLVKLEILDLGDNRIRKIEGLDTLASLSEFYCAKNKLTKIEGLDNLSSLYLLALQANFIDKIEGLDHLSSLTELYLQQNQISAIEGLESLPDLLTLDVAYNNLTSLQQLPPLLEELWLNMNQLADPENILGHLKALKHLKTVYLSDNPVIKALPTTDKYHLYLKEQVPSLEQIDGFMVQQLFRMKQKATEGVEGITKKEIDPKAKAMLEDVIMKN